MSTSSESPQGIRPTSVTEWLVANIDGAVPPFDFNFITGGHSNLTFEVVAADSRRFVLRRPPLGEVLATAHDMGREHRIISGFGQTSVPVPTALGLCEDTTVNDAPFYVMSYVDGVVLHDADIADESFADHQLRGAVSHSTIEVLADLHTVDPDEIGLGDLGRKEAYLDRQLKRWHSQWESSKTRELPTMDEAFALLSEAKPPQRYTGVVHGDYRLGNLLCDPADGSVSAVLDWELCTLGDVLADVGYVLNSWVQPGEQHVRGATDYPTERGGFTTREELVDAYAERTGFEVSGINYYRAFQNWRLAAIVEGVLARYLKGVMVDESVDTELYRLQVESLASESLRLLESE